MNEEQRRMIVRYWWTRAEGSLASAKREFEAKSYVVSMDRLYYAVFYAVCALLHERGQSFQKHAGVRSAFRQNFVKTGLIESEYGELYDRLFQDRQEREDVALVSFEPDYIESQLELCAGFLERLRRFVSSPESQNGMNSGEGQET